jgi:hypothetical protein
MGEGSSGTYDKVRKYVLVPPEVLSRMSGSAFSTSGSSSSSSRHPYTEYEVRRARGDESRENMFRLLERQFATDAEKYALYTQELQEYLDHKRFLEQPMKLSLDESSSAAAAAAAAAARSGGLDKSPGVLQAAVNAFHVNREQARQLADLMTYSPRLGWNSRGEIYVDGRLIPNSNVTRLMQDLVQTRSGRPIFTAANVVPEGRAEFAQALGQTGVANQTPGAIDNRLRLLTPEHFHTPSASTPAPQQQQQQQQQEERQASVRLVTPQSFLSAPSGTRSSSGDVQGSLSSQLRQRFSPQQLRELEEFQQQRRAGPIATTGALLRRAGMPDAAPRDKFKRTRETERSRTAEMARTLNLGTPSSFTAPAQSTRRQRVQELSQNRQLFSRDAADAAGAARAARGGPPPPSSGAAGSDYESDVDYRQERLDNLFQDSPEIRRRLELLREGEEEEEEEPEPQGQGYYGGFAWERF